MKHKATITIELEAKTEGFARELIASYMTAGSKAVRIGGAGVWTQTVKMEKVDE